MIEEVNNTPTYILKERTLAQINEYFDKCAAIVERTRHAKLDEVTSMFIEQRFDDLNDLSIYQDLHDAVKKSILKLH